MVMKVTIIVPIYNSELYLHDCVDSILNQNFTEFELLLINDGSTDISAEICDKYAKENHRVKVIHKENGGVSSARNVGLEYAQGEWITFIDSDDQIKDNYFNVFDKDNESCDLIFTDVDKLTNDNLESFLSFKKKKICIKDFMENYFLFPHFSGCWGKFYKAKTIKMFKLKFDEKLQNGEDGLFNFNFLFKINLVGFSNNAVYIYNSRINSLSNRELDINDIEYLYFSLLQVMETNCLKEKLIARNIGYVVILYFFSILKSKLSFKIKKKTLSDLDNRFNREIVRHLQGTKYTRILSFIIVNKQYNFAILLSNFRTFLFSK